MSFLIRTGLFLSAFSPWWHEDRGTNHEILLWTLLYWPPPPRLVHLSVVSKISTHLCWSRSKLILFHQIRKIQLLASTVEPQLKSFSKSSNSHNRFFRVWRQPPTQFTPARFPVWKFIVTWYLSYPFRAGECIAWLLHLNQKTPYQTKKLYIINEKWLI